MNKRYKPWPPRRSTDAQARSSTVPAGEATPKRSRLGLFGIRRSGPADADPAGAGKITKFAPAFALRRLALAASR